MMKGILKEQISKMQQTQVQYNKYVTWLSRYVIGK